MEDFLRIPSERIAVLIGKKGETRREIEHATGTKIIIDSEGGEVEIESTGAGGKAVELYKAANIVKAIGRGFSPENAMKLMREGYVLDFVNLEEAVGKSRGTQIAKRGRVIGRSGKAREDIEDKTGCGISVYGKTIGIIGKAEDVEKARSAVEMLLSGAKHSSITGFLGKKEARTEKFEL